MSHKILVVDDEKDILVTFQDLLEMEGYKVICAHNARTALALFHELKPDIIITDMMMPGMNGMDLIQVIRKGDDHPHIPIILMSAMASILHYEKKGWDIFIKKPSDIDTILDSVRLLLGKSKSK
ncbi:response regulator [Bacteriovorax sp. PP10]|uniref:Response regulator n=1 Tax=Bacteriovorax antarcticus TaxID=3088717 RepID=A0ABU5VT49_9BACT|nr:response regulator [Bacteriovorax sp. PP10]MEA9356223.1 response regulator [Bacteriovorax sp. PP10]